MAFLDNTLLLSNAQAITTTAASTVIYDVTGAGSGNAPAMTFGTSSNDVGADIGVGQGAAEPGVLFTVTTNGTGTGTITFQIQAAPNSANSPGSYVTLSSSAAFVGTDLDVGDQIWLPIPPFALIEPGMTVPRFYRANYVQTGDGAVSVTAAILMNPPLGYISTQYGGNFVAA